MHWLWIRRPRFNGVRVGGATPDLSPLRGGAAQELAGVRPSGATGGLLAWGLVQKDERGVRKPLVALDRHGKVRGSARTSDGGRA